MKSKIAAGRRKVRTVEVDYGKAKRKHLAIPDQSLSLKTIIERYTRGVPVDIKHREPVWSDQTEFDLEKMSRMDFGEKMSIAEELRARYDAIQEAFEARRADAEQAQKEAEEARKEPVKAPKEQSPDAGKAPEA